MSDDKELDGKPATEAILEHWRQSAPDDRMAHLVRDAARGLTRALQLRLSDHDISFGHWAFLRILWEQDGLTQRQLSVRAGLMEPTTHSAILKMVDLGFVTRRHPENNKRKLAIFLTAEGRTLEKTLVPLAEEVNGVAAEGVSQMDLETTRNTLLAMIENLAIDEERAIEGGKKIMATREQSKRSASRKRSTGN
jgi:MarR family transcriptional regulator, organic hydroperoxide resistance regulator